MSFRTGFTLLCNLMFPCFSVDSNEDVDQESPSFDCSGENEELPDSVIRKILSKQPVESIITYRGVCKSWYRVVHELCKKKSNGNQSSSSSGSRSITELPDSVILKILSKIPVKSIITFRGVCKSWYRVINELSNKLDGDQNSNGSDTSFVSELPDLMIRDILLTLPTTSIRSFCKAWNQVGKELSDVSKSFCLNEFHTSVLHEILLKLPLTSIIQCRYVCKSWYQLISDPYFAKCYFNNQNLISIAFSKHDIFIYDPSVESFGFLEIGIKGDVRRKLMINVNMKSLTSPVTEITKDKKSWKTLVGLCDGLLCFVENPYEEPCYVNYYVINRLHYPNQTVWIVNPVTGEYMDLPKVHGVDHDSVVYGFGSTVDGDYYKIVRVAVKYLGDVVDAHILTIGVDSKWRNLDLSTFPPSLYSQGVNLNGVLHWIGLGSCCCNAMWGHVIYAFDLGKETGKCFPFPCEVDYLINTYLGVLDGHLCMITNNDNLQVDLWTMKCYGVVDSWRRDIITTNSLPPLNELIPVTTMRNGELLLFSVFDNSLMTFEPRTKKCVQLEVTEVSESRLCVFAFTPSFISPHGLKSRQIYFRNY